MTLLEQSDHSKNCTHKPCRSTKGRWKPVYQYWRVWNSPLPIMFPKSFMSGIHNRGMSNALIILLVLLCIFLRLFHRFYVGMLNFFLPPAVILFISGNVLSLKMCFIWHWLPLVTICWIHILPFFDFFFSLGVFQVNRRLLSLKRKRLSWKYIVWDRVS